MSPTPSLTLGLLIPSGGGGGSSLLHRQHIAHVLDPDPHCTTGTTTSTMQKQQPAQANKARAGSVAVDAPVHRQCVHDSGISIGHRLGALTAPPKAVMKFYIADTTITSAPFTVAPACPRATPLAAAGALGP